MERAPNQPGDRVGVYEIVKTISEGRNATVFEARAADGALVAIKLLAGAAAAHTEALASRFRHEIDVLARVDHPNVVALLDHGFHADGRPFLVTPFIEGQHLRDRFGGKAVCPEVALLLLSQVAAGLAALHASGLVHRDLKPENIMLTPRGQVVIIDLGLVLASDHTRYTEEGAIVGSVPYMSPEQIEGLALTPTSDVWSLGIMAYEWVAGARPFQRPRQSEEVAAILAGKVAPITDVDRRASTAFRQLIDRSLQLDPTSRPADATAVLQDVQAQLDWLGEGNVEDELRAIALDGAGYATRVRPARVRASVMAAEQALARRDWFAASREIDRGLAYAPEDPTLLALVEHAIRPPATGGTPEPSSRRWLVPALVAVLLGGGITIGVLAAGDDPAPAQPVDNTVDNTVDNAALEDDFVPPQPELDPRTGLPPGVPPLTDARAEDEGETSGLKSGEYLVVPP